MSIRCGCRRIGISFALSVLVLAAGCGGASTPPPPPPPQNPQPAITTISPSATLVGSGSQTLTISGSNFLASSTATFSGTSHSVTFVNSGQLTIQLTSPDQATAGTYAVVVSNPAPGGGASNISNFTVNNPQPSLASVSPSVFAAGSPDTPISLVGANFVPQSTVNLNGTALATSFASSNQLSVSVPANSLASGRVNRVAVATPAPGGGTSGSLDLIVTESLPAGVSGPLIESFPPVAALVGKLTQYQVIASSNSSSSLVFSLSTFPAGMTINATTGLLQWTPGLNQAGDQPVSIVAKDSAGQTSQSFTLSVFGSRPVASAFVSAAAGATITVNDSTSTINGLLIGIPARALAADTTITVSELIAPPTLGGTPHFLLKGFSVDPDGMQLAIPAGIKIPYSVNEFATTQGIPIEDFLGTYFVDTSTGGLQYLSSFTVDKLNHVLNGTLQHFSVYPVTNIARLCPPPTASSVCPNTSAPPSSLLRPVVLVHGFMFDVFNPLTSSGAMGTEAYWGRLRYLLAGLGPGGSPIHVDAWRFDWDSNYTTFERSAANLASALCDVEFGQPDGCSVLPDSAPRLVNLVAHSFGGILVRTYLEGLANAADPKTTPNLTYRNDVNRVMTIGTPHSGIGGSFSTFYANACAVAAQLTPLVHEPITCFEANTAGSALFKDTGAFLNALNGQPLPPLNTSLTPQYDLIAGQRFECAFVNNCALQLDDGLITTAGNQLCGGLPGSGGSPAVCSQTSVIEEINPGNLPANTGLCHSSALFVTTCSPGNNTAMTDFKAPPPVHPLWGKICNFLGGCPRILTVSSTNASSGTLITARPIDNNGLSGSFTPQFTLTYTDGTKATLTAPSTSGGNNFSNWAGCDTTKGVSCTVTITADRTLTANYAPPTTVTHTLIVASANPTSGATITASPADNSGQSNGTTQFTRTYNNGVVVFLGAAATAGGNKFSSWTGCDSVSGTTCTVTLNADRAVTANYAPASTGPHTLTVASTSPSSGAAITVSPADNGGKTSGVTQFTLTYNNGTLVTLMAAPAAGGHSFASWSGCDSVSSATCTVTMNSDRTVSANYGVTPGFAYVANQNSGDVSAYKIDPASGALTSSGTFASGIAPASVAANPAGRCLYVANSQDPITIISVFSISTSTGALTAAPSVPLSLQEFFPMSIAVHPTGKYAYVANQEGTVSGFTIDPNTCALTRFQGSPYAAGTLPQSATIDPSGNFLYVTNLGDNDISSYKIDSVAGGLTPIVGSPFPAGNGPTSLTVQPTGKFAFATNSFDNSVLGYARDTTTGVLTQLGPFATGGGSFSAAVDPTGRFVYVAYLNGGNLLGDVEGYMLNTATGALTQFGLFATGTSPVSVTVDPSGKFLYVANNGSTSVSAFQIDSNNGMLTPVPPVGFFPAGAGPISVTTTATP